jgi:hypothetical protein
VVCAALTVLLVGCQGKRMKPPTIEWQPATHELAPLMPNGIQMNGTAVLTVDGRQYLVIVRPSPCRQAASSCGILRFERFELDLLEVV